LTRTGECSLFVLVCQVVCACRALAVAFVTDFEAAAAIAASIANCTDPSFVGADELDAILRHGTSGYPQRR
jgi:hypothetical protein